MVPGDWHHDISSFTHRRAPSTAFNPASSHLLNHPVQPSWQPAYPSTAAGPSRLPPFLYNITPPNISNMATHGPVPPLVSFGPYRSSNDVHPTRHQATANAHVSSRARQRDTAEEDYPVAKRARRSFSGSVKDSTPRQVAPRDTQPPATIDRDISSTAGPSTSEAGSGSVRTRSRPQGSNPTSTSASSPRPIRPSSSPKSRNITVVCPGKDAFELKYSPEQLFVMLKGQEYEGSLPSVGLKGPRDERRAQDGEGAGLGKKTTSRAVKQDIWTDEAEFAFLAAELYIPPSSASKVMFLNKPCGRNEIIGLVVTMALGKLMTRKQVSSHLQVVRQRKKMNPELKLMFDQDDLAGTVAQGSPHLRGVNARLNEIMGLEHSCDLSTTPKPSWITTMESKHPGPEYRSRRRSASVSGDSTAGDDTVTSGDGAIRRQAAIALTIPTAPPARKDDVRTHRAHAWLEQQESGADSEDESGSDGESEGSASSSGESSAIYPETSSSAGATGNPNIRIVRPAGDDRWNVATSVSPSYTYAVPHPVARPQAEHKQAGRAAPPAAIISLESVSISASTRKTLIRATDVGTIRYQDIPTWDIRFGNDVLQRHGNGQLLHATVEIDPLLLIEDNLRFDLELSHRASNPSDSRALSPPTVTGFSGYLESYQGQSGGQEAARLGGDGDKPGSLPWIMPDRFRAQTTETVLPTLLRDQMAYETALDGSVGTERALEAVLPYYWTVHVVSTEGAESSTRREGECAILYTYLAGAPGTFAVKLGRIGC